MIKNKEEQMENDLKLVDEKIREYYELDKKESEENMQEKKNIRFIWQIQKTRSESCVVLHGQALVGIHWK